MKIFGVFPWVHHILCGKQRKNTPLPEKLLAWSLAQAIQVIAYNIVDTFVLLLWLN